MRATDAFYLAIGRFVSSWSELETSLDLLALIARSLTGRLHEPPHQLSGKIAFIQKRLPAFSSQHRERLEKLLIEIDALSVARHDFVHGSMSGFEPHRKGMIVTLWRVLQPKGPRRKPVKVTARQIARVTNRVREITDELLNLAQSANATTPG